jgi:hypothetical protein
LMQPPDDPVPPAASPRSSSSRRWLLRSLALVLGIPVCTFAVIGVVSVVDGGGAAPAAQDRPGGLIVQPRSAPLGLAVSKRAITNCTSVNFTGRIPPKDVLVVLEARYPGGTWKQFRIVHPHRDGRFAARYGFTRTTTKTRYRFRALTAPSAPTVIAPSEPTSVLVNPLRAGSSPPRRECAAPPGRR